MTEKKWPDSIPTRTADEWRALGANWEIAENRKIFVDTLTALKVPAMQYATGKGPQRAELLIKIQEELVPGSTAAKKAAAPAAAKAAPAAAKKAGPSTTVATAASGASGGSGGGVDLAPLYAKLEELSAAVAALQATTTESSTILKLLLLNPNNADSLTLAATAEVVAEIGAKSVVDLASGNG